MTMPETYRNINELLKPLDICLKQHVDDGYFYFCHATEKYCYANVFCDNTFLVALSNMNCVVHCMLNAKCFSPFLNANNKRHVVENPIVENPYFGCKNLEEAMIMKDLTVKTEQ